VRLFSSLRLVVAPPACEPGQDTPVIFSSRLNHWLRVSHRFWRCVRPQPRVSPLLSQAAFFSQSSGAVFSIAGLGSFSRGLPSLRVLPGTDSFFVPPFGVFYVRLQLFYFCRRQSFPPVLMRSSNLSPFGDCDSSVLETCPDYLTHTDRAGLTTIFVSYVFQGATWNYRTNRIKVCSAPLFIKGPISNNPKREALKISDPLTQFTLIAGWANSMGKKCR
jgi:hypothetical protein